MKQYLPKRKLVILLGVAFLSLGGQRIFSQQRMISVQEKNNPSEEEMALPVINIPDKEYPALSELRKGCPLFGLPVSAAAQDLESQDNKQSATTAVVWNSSKNYILTGIIMDGNPVAVIQDQAAKQTLFLGKGGVLAGAALTKIEQGRVEFRYLEQTYEMKF